ncbi:whirlin [Cimex lectularius]|uniref:PDZ domain-containing protein n=1 Tax=Cimex lectularius TaxID=79782 RepID=A0A8I6ST51_CIMLE|nr:whirlin [Cimex lectularius]XP_024085656.1 whirlin [Cimex lectularius]
MAFTGRSGYSSGSSSTGSSGGARVRSVTLTRRPSSTKLGFSIRGGKEHGTGFFVTAVEHNSEASKSGLMVGDQILRVNGFPVEDATHKEVLHLIQGQPTITLKVKSVGMIPVKENPEDELSWQIVDASNSPTHLDYKPDLCDENSNISPVSDVRMVLKVPPRAKLGCGICKGPDWKPGVFVQFTKENSIARVAGLRPGDQIVQCNNFTFTPETPFSEAVSVMRCSGVLELIVRKGAGLELFPGESSGYNSSASSVAGDNPPSRLSVLHEESNHNGFNDACIERNGNGQNRSDYSNGCTVIHVGGDEPDSTANKKIAEICMVSQQLETKTTTVFVEVHHSEDDTVSHTQSDTSTDRLTNSSSVSSFTSSASSLSSAISQELERRSKRTPAEIAAKTNHQTDKLIKSGLAKEKVQQHEQLMQEFRKAHKKMFSGDQQENVNDEEREETRLAAEQKVKTNGETEKKLEERKTETERTNKHQTAPPPPPPLPNGKEKEKVVYKPNHPSTKKYPAPMPPAPPSPPYCPTPDYDTTSLASDSIEENDKRSQKNSQKGDIVEMQSLESFKLTNPSKVKPKPPNTYFTQNPSLTSDTSNGTASTLPIKDKPVVTIREYPGGKERKNPAKFDFLQNIPPPVANDGEPIGARLQNELSHTLSRATVLTKNETQVTNFNQNGQNKKGTVVMINGTSNQEPAKPFYLFPANQMNSADSKKITSIIHSVNKPYANGRPKSNIVENGTKNSVTFNFSNKTQEVRNVNHTQPNGILKNGNNNIAQIQIQSIDKTHKSIKFGGS